MPFKPLRFGPALADAARSPGFFDQVHVVFGGTGAVGGATVLQLMSMFEEARRLAPDAAGEPRIVVTGRSKAEVRSFTQLLHRIQVRDHGAEPEHLADRGYRTRGGVVIELETFGVDPTIPELAGLSVKEAAGQREALAAFLAAGGLTADSPRADQLAWLTRAVQERVGAPFSEFVTGLRERAQIAGKIRSVVVGIPMASVTTYKLADLEVAAAHLGVAEGSPELEQLKERYLAAIADDLARVEGELAEEVLIAHTTAVGGMYDPAPDGGPEATSIRIGFAHSAKGQLLAEKQRRADKLTALYAERRIKMLITAAAIGVDAILVRERLPLNGRIKAQLQLAASEGAAVVPSDELGTARLYPPVRLSWTGESVDPVSFECGQPLAPEHTIRSGENGFFSVPNADALYRVMRVTSTTELGLVLARVALLGDDPVRPFFADSRCYYDETDNSRQVFDLLADPPLMRNQLSGLEPKSLQDLGSAKHQGELHTLGLLILLHRLRELDVDSIPRGPVDEGRSREIFDERSPVLTLERAALFEPDELARDFAVLVGAREPLDLVPLLRRAPLEADLLGLEPVLREVLHAVWTVASLGTPILFGGRGSEQVLCGPFVAPLDAVLRRRDTIESVLRREFERLGGGSDAEFDRLREFHIAGFGFCDLRPVAVLTTARSADDGLDGRVSVHVGEDDFLQQLDRVTPYSYFATSGLVALMVRLKGLARMVREYDVSLGSANEYRAQLYHDETGRALLVPGVVEAFRMVWEGLEKNTGLDRLDGAWGYPRPR